MAKKKQQAKVTGESGDCFVVQASSGLFWSGSEWVREWRQARQFGGPVDPYPECQQLADELRSRFGLACNVAYIRPLPHEAAR